VADSLGWVVHRNRSGYNFHYRLGAFYRRTDTDRIEDFKLGHYPRPGRLARCAFRDKVIEGITHMKITWMVLGLAFGAGIVLADAPMGNMPMGTTPAGSKFAGDMDVSMKVMDHDMSSAPMTGNADHDFASMMVPHHQGAVDMAKAELEYGKDPAMRQLATRIIADQKKEIALMQSWLKTPAAAQP
jgi:hypothetical protein